MAVPFGPGVTVRSGTGPEPGVLMAKEEPVRAGYSVYLKIRSPSVSAEGLVAPVRLAEASLILSPFWCGIAGRLVAPAERWE